MNTLSQSTGSKSAGRTWPEAADGFARRTTRRRRFGALLMPLALGLLAGALGALAAAWIAPSPWHLPWTWLALGLGLGVLIGSVRAGAVVSVAPADAAWALDRIAGASERGLSAATIKGPRGAEAAFARPALVPPPRVRLLPARGMAVFIGALLLALVAAVVGQTRSQGTAALATESAAALDSASSAVGSSLTTTNPVEAAEAAAKRSESDAAAAERVLAAIGLAPDEPVDPAELADLLSDAARRDAARAAAGPGGLGETFDDPGTSAKRMAQRLAHAAEGRVAARNARRRAAGARAESVAPALPPSRRDVVERYQDRLRGAPSTSGRTKGPR